jgi:pyruvate,water dikinase
MARRSSSILWFSEIDKEDIKTVGGKGLNLGEMVQNGFPVPDGFVVSSYAYSQFLRHNNLTTRIHQLLSTVHFARPDSLMQVSMHIKKLIMEGKMSDELVKEIFDSYKKLGGVFKNALVAVRSSATTEDLPTASFAGQQETYLNVHGEANLLLKIREAWASLFEPRAMFCRHEQNFDHFRIGIAVIVQKMIESEKSGVMFTLDPVINDKSKIIVEAIYGLGEMIVQGEVTPDHYEVTKSDLQIINPVITTQNVMLKKVGGENKQIKISSRDAKKQKITNNQILDLALLGKKLEKHYYFPQDIEWAIEKNKIYIVQTRAITTIHTVDGTKTDSTIANKLPIVLKGTPASPGIVCGPVKILNNARDMGSILPGDILIVPQTNPDFIATMKKAGAIITDKGGRTSHAAIICRELGIPAVVGTEKSTSILRSGLIVTVNGTTGEIYKGAVSTHTDHAKTFKTATRVYVMLPPSLIEKVTTEPIDGVGLLQAESVITDIGIHPKKLIQEGKQHIYVNKLAEALETVCKAIAPRPVVYQLSNLQTTDYRALIGGEEFEPVEANPLLGLRGAHRYIHDTAVFKLELEAIKKVRDKNGLNNLWMTIPFVRTVNELIEVKRIISAADLHRSPTFKLWMSIEVPSNVILLDKFIEAGIDGISIGTDDLTALLLGTDKNNSEVSKAFDEQNPAVLWALEQIIKTAHKHHITSSIYGQAPSLQSSLIEKLITWGISSVSVSPDALDVTRHRIAEAERKLVESRFPQKNT